MGIQVIHHQPNFDRRGVTLIKHLFDLLCPILSGATLRHRHMWSAGQRFNFHEYFCYAITYIFIIDSLHLPRFT